MQTKSWKKINKLTRASMPKKKEGNPKKKKKKIPRDGSNKSKANEACTTWAHHPLEPPPTQPPTASRHPASHC